MKYSLRKNNLTSPVSFRPIVNITSVLGLFELSAFIKNKVPTITQDEIMQALVAFKSVSLDQLLAGNALNIKNFFSIRPAIRKGKLNLNFEIIPECSKCVAKSTIAKKMIADAKLSATFTFSGETTEGKTSSKTTVPGTGTIDSCGIPKPGDPDVNVTALAKIIQVYSMPYGIDNHIHNDSGLIVVGENLVFDPDIPDSGIWIKSANNTSRLQSDIISIDPKTVRVVGEVDFTGGPAGTNSVEHVLWLSRINSLGVQKITNYSSLIRKTNYVTEENNQLLITDTQTEGPLSVIEYSGPESLYKITFYKEKEKVIMIVYDLSNEHEYKTMIINDNQFVKINTKDGFIILIVNSINKLFSAILKYGGFLKEVISINPFKLRILPSATGQITVFRSGDDADNIDTERLMSFTKLDLNGQSLPDSAPDWDYIKDNNSNLIYKSDIGTYTRDSATQEALLMNDLGKSWRIPTFTELMNIFLYKDSNPILDQQFFPLSGLRFVNHNQGLGSENIGMVSINNGLHAWYSKATTGNVIFVSGEDIKSYLLDNTDGTLTDLATNLMWTKEVKGPATWDNSIDNAQNDTTGGFNDWRLPNIKELLSVIYYPSVYIQELHPFFSTSFKYMFFWTSTTDSINASNAWNISLSQGKTSFAYISKQPKNNSSFKASIYVRNIE